jgi:hypothetical protein
VSGNNHQLAPAGGVRERTTTSSRSVSLSLRRRHGTAGWEPPPGPELRGLFQVNHSFIQSLLRPCFRSYSSCFLQIPRLLALSLCGLASRASSLQARFVCDWIGCGRALLLLDSCRVLSFEICCFGGAMEILGSRICSCSCWALQISGRFGIYFLGGKIVSVSRKFSPAECSTFCAW